MSYTYYQAKNQEDQVTEEELPIRLQTINNIIKYIDDDGTRYKIKSPQNMFTFYNEYDEDIMKIEVTKDITCYGNIVAPNITTLNNKTQNINTNGTVLSNINTINSQNFNDLVTFVNYMYPIVSEMTRVPPGIDIPYIYTGSIQMRSAVQGLSIINKFNSTSVIKFYDDKTTECFGNLTVPTLNGNKIGSPDTFINNNYSPFIPVCDASGAIELGSSLDFHDLTTEQDNKCRLSCVGSNTLEIIGTGSIRATRFDASAGMALRSGNTLMKFQKSDGTTNMLTLDATTNVATFLGNIVTPSLNGNKIGASNEGFGYTTDAPYIPVCKANGITEIGYRLDFHLLMLPLETSQLIYPILLLILLEFMVLLITLVL